MELTLPLIISILSIVFVIINFAVNRKDKAVNDRKEQDKEKTNQELIDYRLEQVEKKLDKILVILDDYDKEIDTRVNKAIEQHILIYHKGK